MEWDGESELTADEAAEYIFANRYLIARVYKNRGALYRMKGESYPHYAVYIKDGSTPPSPQKATERFQGETLTAALNAAARAVYRRQGQ